LPYICVYPNDYYAFLYPLVTHSNTYYGMGICLDMEQPNATIDNIACYVWNGRLHGELADFDEFCAVQSEISNALRRQL